MAFRAIKKAGAFACVILLLVVPTSAFVLPNSKLPTRGKDCSVRGGSACAAPPSQKPCADRRTALGFLATAVVALLPAAQSAMADGEAASAFVGRYTDPNHPGGIRDIQLLDTNIGEFQLARVTGGGGRGEPKSFELPAMIQLPEKRITIDFTPKGGPRDFTGLWDGDGIKFPDGNKWPKA